MNEIKLKQAYPKLDNQIQEIVNEIGEQIGNTHEVYEMNNEAIECNSRDGFISQNDGGYKSTGFIDLGYIFGSGNNNFSKKATKAIDDSIEYNLKIAREQFIEDNKEALKGIPEDKINYHDLYELKKEDLAEQLSNKEMDYLSEDTIMLEVLCMFNNNGDDDLSFTVQTIVNWEAPYHRNNSKFEDHYQEIISFTKDTQEIAIKKVKEAFKKGLYVFGI